MDRTEGDIIGIVDENGIQHKDADIFIITTILIIIDNKCKAVDLATLFAWSLRSSL